MGANELGIRFSNSTYATQQDVKRVMKIPIIDNIWKQILEYRSNFQMLLSLKHITGESYSVCLTPVIQERINNVERKLVRGMINYSKLGKNGKNAFKEQSKLNILRSIANKYKIDIEDRDLLNIINHNDELLSSDYMVIMSYNSALDVIENNYVNEINDDYLAMIFSSLLGTDDLVEFYRTKDVRSSYSKAVINRIYLGVPADNIESSMDLFFNFLRTSNTSLFVKGVCALYYLYYVQPFETFSEEISVLLFKSILAHYDLEEVAVYLNIEDILIKKEELESFIIESQKTLDLTYIIDYVLKKFEANLDDFFDRITKSKRNEIAEETYSTEPVTNSSEVINKALDIPKNEQIQTVQIQNQEQSTVNYNKAIAFSNIPAGLSEEEAAKLETHLLEIYPDLSRSQAYFYARHCTLGCKYTIAQFKKEVGCAYETARTSMDFLVFLGFYRKEPLKNKFVYIPVKKN